MVEITLKADNIDYNSIAEYILPFVTEQMEQSSLGRIFFRSPEAARGAALSMLSKMSQQKKDELLAKFLNQNSAKAAEGLEQMAARSGIGLKISGISARAE